MKTKDITMNEISWEIGRVAGVSIFDAKTTSAIKAVDYIFHVAKQVGGVTGTADAEQLVEALHMLRSRHDDMIKLLAEHALSL